MRQGEVVELEIPSAPEYVSIVRHAVEGIARRMKFNTSQIEDIKLAVGEACTNAVRHGNRQVESSQVEVRCIIEPDGLMVEIRNSITESKHPKVPRKPDLTKEGGYGLYMIRQLVDDVDILWDCETATIRMLKRLAPTAV